MDARKLQGMAVVTLAEADRVGRVKDLVFEADPLRAVALRIGGDQGEALVPFGMIREIGPDAIMTDSAEAVTTLRGQEGRNLPGIDDLGQLKVVDEHGTFLGRITMLDVDPADGRVSGFDVRKGEVLGIGGETQSLAAERIVSVGSEILTIRGEADEPRTAGARVRPVDADPGPDRADA